MNDAIINPVYPARSSYQGDTERSMVGRYMVRQMWCVFVVTEAGPDLLEAMETEQEAERMCRMERQHERGNVCRPAAALCKRRTACNRSRASRSSV